MLRYLADDIDLHFWIEHGLFQLEEMLGCYAKFQALYPE